MKNKIKIKVINKVSIPKDRTSIIFELAKYTRPEFYHFVIYLPTEILRSYLIFCITPSYNRKGIDNIKKREHYSLFPIGFKRIDEILNIRDNVWKTNPFAISWRKKLEWRFTRNNL